MNKKITSTRPEYTSKVNTTGTTTGRTSSRVPAKSNTPKKSSSGSDLDAVKLLVATLSAEDQQALLDHLALSKRNCGISSQQERKLNLFTDSLAQELGKHLGQSSRVFPLPLLPQAKKMFKDVERLMLDLKLDNLNTKGTKAFYNVLASVLVQYAQTISNKANIPVNMKLILQTTTPLHALLDNQFPSYIRAGLMSLVIQQAQSGNVEDNEDD